jgi:hypothetical protein
MESLEKQIQDFLKIDYGSGAGFGDGSGFGLGFGNSDGSGYGNGYDYGFSYCSGSGDGYGDGSGFGNSDGSGFGFGHSDGVLSINNQKVYKVDGVPTIITKIRNNIAKGFILKGDLTLEHCYVVKSNNMFAHGKDLKEAMKSLQEKIFEDLSEEERINMFLNEFEKDKKYKGHVFFDWHNKLTGSCLMGRKVFVEENELDLEKEYTVDEFIELTKNAYGSNIIKDLEKRWKQNESR